jgi:homoserine dehydrogenase
MITVLKFGGSVLRDESDLKLAVHEIYRNWRQGSQVVAVVSAFNGKTDELLAKTSPFGDDAHAESVASLLLTGETETASLLCLELGRSGIPARFLTALQLQLLTKGERLDAEPVSINAERLRHELISSVVVVSGFGGVDQSGSPTLLGRGGSDLTALFLAERLDARCVLVKDTDGLFEFDPNASAALPRRFS